jgi:hypothetical protein
MNHKDIIVKDKFRTNDLSKTPGGHTVTVSYFSSTRDRVYKNVNNPTAYVNSMKADSKIRSIKVDGIQVYSQSVDLNR